MTLETLKQKLLNLQNWNHRATPWAAFALLVVGLVALNVLLNGLMSLVPLRLDITQERIFTLSQGSKAIVSSLDKPVTLKLYYSEGVGETPIAFKTYSRKVLELLREYEAVSGGKVRLEQHDPRPDTDEEQWAARYGITPARLPSGESMYFGMVTLQEEREAVVPFFDPRREKFLEYDISQALTRVSHPEKPSLGVLSFLPVGAQYTRGPGGQDWAFLTELRKSYTLEFFTPDTLKDVPDTVRLMMVIHPKALPNGVNYALDQFLLRGGKLMVMVDPNSRVDPANQQGGQFGAPTNSTLELLLKSWGIKYDPLMVLGDQALATRVNTPNGVVDFPIWVTLRKGNMNMEVPLANELEEVTLIDSGTFEPAEGFKYSFTPLMTSSAQSSMLDFTTVRMTPPQGMMNTVKPDGKQRVVAAMITGVFATAFPDGPPPQDPNTPPTPNAPKGPKGPHLSTGEKESTVLLVGDADFLSDEFSVQVVNFFGNRVMQPVNDNLNFIQNAVEFLLGSQDLIHIRSRGQFSRPFTRVETLQTRAAQRFHAEEQRLSDQLEKVTTQLREIEQQKGKGAEKVLLSPQQIQAVNQYRQQEQRTKKALREVRKLLREDIERLGNVLLAMNLLLVPLVVAGVGFSVIYRRGIRRRSK
ncbi:MAG: Gldg family protein [Deltaproteobacteria bacterium]|nr:Gldg family protein [Deltaproteobacteria bacterium]